MTTARQTVPLELDHCIHHQRPIQLPCLSGWVTASAQCGFKARPILKEHGISLERSYPHELVTPRQVLGALNDCVIASRQGHFPLALGHVFSFDYFPALGTFLATSPSLRSLIAHYNTCRQMIHPWSRLDLHEEGDSAWIGTDLPVPRSDLHPYRYVIEATLSFTAKLIGTLLGEPSPPRGIQLRHADPPYSRHYQDYFGRLPTFGQPRNAIEIDRAWLDRPVNQHQHVLHEQARAAVERRLSQRDADLARQIEHLLMGTPGWLGAHIDDVAARFQMSAFTLQSQLRHENTRFSDIQAHVRHALARQLLRQPDMAIHTVSQRLGYPNRRAFTSAFKLKENLSPTEYRDRHLGLAGLTEETTL